VEREEEARDTVVEFSWVGETARHVGSVVHAFLQRMAEEGLGKWNTERIEGLDVVLRLALKQEGVPERELGSAHARVMQGLRGVLADPRARWILGASIRRRVRNTASQASWMVPSSTSRWTAPSSTGMGHAGLSTTRPARTRAAM
jgi:hypothetical protein